MSHPMNMTRALSRRAVLSVGAATLALTLAACGSSSEEAKDQDSAQATATAQTSESSQAASAQETGVRDDNGYHLNDVVDDAPTVTLFTDYQCPYCEKAEPAFEEAANQLNGTMNVTVKHFPLPMHQYAVHASVAVQAAENQGKHLAMAHKVFEAQEEWETAADAGTLFSDYLSVYAEELGLDAEQFKQDYESEETVQAVKADYDQAQEIGVKGTPTFVVNGKPLENVDSSKSADEMAKAFREATGL